MNRIEQQIKNLREEGEWLRDNWQERAGDECLNAADTMQTLYDVAKAAEILDPDLDALICYSSTMDEYPPNEAVRNLREALDRLRGMDDE